MIYSFDADVAKEYGINEAVMIANFQFWISKNKANGKNFIDGHYWTYNSNKAFQELFPFWSAKTIRTTLDHLKTRGILITGNHNTKTYDRTLWFAFADEEKWVCPRRQMDLPKTANGFVENGKPIPDIIPDINTDNKETKNNKLFLEKKVDQFDLKTMELWNAIADKYKLAKVSLITERRHTALLARMKDVGIQELDEFFERIRKAIRESTFLRGKEYVNTGNGYESRNKEWRCDFDFFLQQKSLVRALEGGYADPDLVR